MDRTIVFRLIREEACFDDVRDWNNDRYERMTFLRNQLLGTVREYNPDYFLSLDSDIFIAEDSLVTLFESIENFDAVGGKCYMSPGTRAPSYAMMPHTTLLRPDSSEVMEVEIIMAMKLMKPSAYKVDYVTHYHGEDIGWSLECKVAGLRLGWDGRITNKHCMDKSDVLVVDPRCGY